MTMDEIIEAFDVDGISHSSSIFDEAKMRWLNGEYLKAMSEEQFYDVALEWIDKAVGQHDYNKKELALLMQTRVDILSEIPQKLEFLNNFGPHDLAMYEHRKMKVDKPLALKCVLLAKDILSNVDDWNADAIKAAISDGAEKAGLKGGQVMFSMRVALTGEAVTPGGAIEMAVVLKKTESLNRLDFSAKLLADSLND